MGYPPGWTVDREKIRIEKWKSDHPDFPWISKFTEEEKNTWILSIPNNGPQPNVLWDEYDLLKFTAELDKALKVDKTELQIGSLGRVRAVDRQAQTSSFKQVIAIEIQLDGKWIEVWSQPWNGAEFTKQYAMQDIPMNILIESQMIDLSFIDKYSWKNTPFAERYKDWLSKTAGTCAWAFMTLATETKGVVVTGADITPNIDDRGVLVGYYVNLHVANEKAGYVIKYNWGQPVVVGPDGKIIK